MTQAASVPGKLSMAMPENWSLIPAVRPVIVEQLPFPERGVSILVTRMVEEMPEHESWQVSTAHTTS